MARERNPPLVGRGNPRRFLREPSSTRPGIWLQGEGKGRSVVKDYRFNGAVFRNTVGRFLVWREQKALRRLQGIRGIPALYGVIDGLALVLEAIPGRSVENLEKERTLPHAFFEALGVVMAEVHTRGLAHCDLKRAANILVGEDDRPYVVDWSASLSRTECCIPPLDRVFARFVLDDGNAITKLKLRHRPQEVSPEELGRYTYRSTAEKAIRRVRDRLREWLQRLA